MRVRLRETRGARRDGGNAAVLSNDAERLFAAAWIVKALDARQKSERSERVNQASLDAFVEMRAARPNHAEACDHLDRTPGRRAWQLALPPAEDITDRVADRAGGIADRIGGAAYDVSRSVADAIEEAAQVAVE
jgi:hypothetical protein